MRVGEEHESGSASADDAQDGLVTILQSVYQSLSDVPDDMTMADRPDLRVYNDIVNMYGDLTGTDKGSAPLTISTDMSTLKADIGES